MSIWRKSPIFPEYYMVSDDGKVLSIRNNKVLTPATDKCGYYYYVLCVAGDRRTVKAHRLVAKAFIPNPQGHPTVKKTCLWLKGLPELQPTNIVEVDTSDVYEYVAKNGHIKHDSRNRSRCKTSERSTHRSKTFSGIAKAMSEQWG